MNAKNFSDAMGEIDGRYIEEAALYAAGSNFSRRVRRFRLAWIAATLALLLTGAGVVAAAYGDSIQSWFGHYWEMLTGARMSDGQSALISHLSQEIGQSQTVGDVTVTVDSATLGRDNFFLLVRVSGIKFSKRYGYEFDRTTVDERREPPVTGSSGMISYGFAHRDIDGDGSLLLLLDYSWTNGDGDAEEIRRMDLVVTLEDLMQNPATGKEKLLAEGKWRFSFSLDYDKEIASVRLPDTEIAAVDLEKTYDAAPVSVVIREIELTCTGLSFQYDDNGGTLMIEPHIEAVLDNGQSISSGGGGGTRLADGRTLNCSCQWMIPVNPDEVAYIEIGETQIAVP